MVVKKKSEKTESVSSKVEKHDDADYVELPVGRYVEKVRANPWIAATFALALVLVLVLIFGTGSGTGVSKVSADEAGRTVVAFLNSNPAIEGEVTVISAQEEGQFYQVMLNYQGQEVPVYTTLDGQFLVGNPVSLKGDSAKPAATTQTPSAPKVDTSAPKSDKPVVELFVMSHCPFGTQMEKGILPVVTLLGDSIDFEVKFVNYAMHGEVEVYEQLNQYCIQTEQNAKYLDYLQCFLESGDDEACLTETKVDKVKLAACAAREDQKLGITKNLEDQASWLSGRFPKFMTHDADNKEYGVQGSPTLVINGQQVSSGRDPASLLATICSTFTEAPAECETELSSATPSPGFGWSTTAADSAALAQCG